MRIRLGVADGKWVIEDAAFAFGGMAIKTILATATAKAIIGKEFSTETFDTAKKEVMKELVLPDGVPGGQAAFRMTLCASFLHRFFLSVVEDLQKDVETAPSGTSWPVIPSVQNEELTGTKSFVDAIKPSITGVQKYPEPKVATGLEGKLLPAVKDMGKAGGEKAVGKPSPHQSGPLHCTGEALYTDDIPLPPSTLQAALVLATECGSTFQGLDTDQALAIPGVVAVFSEEDIKSLGGKNELGPIVHDEFVFLPVGEQVRGVGQVLGIVVGETLESAESGARAVKVRYGEDKEKLPVSIEDAIAAKSFYDFGIHSIERGDLDVVDKLSAPAQNPSSPSVGDTVTVSGSVRCPGQEHFYLETNSSLVVPSESDTNLTIYCSTQAPTKTQNFCASSTGTPASKVVVRMKRMGGGFGGKETRSVFASCAAAVAAKKTGRPVRLTLSREVDMMTTGTRHAFVAFYTASAVITEEGPKLHACDVKMYW
jgi:xanthine dehydrogenase/oxidase